jgi:UDPglucose 6-dehydrogenase/GDP-mannose 6-dehydrogenase
VKVSVFGAGYVGLVTAACLAELGHSVVCVDVDARKVERIQAGESPIFEPGLDDLLRKGLASGRFAVTTSVREALDGSDLSMIAVGTPDREGRIDLRYVLEVAGCLGDFIRETGTFHTVVVKSTVIPGTTLGSVRETLEQRSGKRAGQDFGLGMNPEFLREGSAVRDFAHPDRVVLGSFGSRSAEMMLDLYRAFDCPNLVVHPTEAECIKYAANALLSTLISFSNEIFNLCEALPGVSGRTVLEGALADHRWTPQVDGKPLKPGIQSYVMGGVGYGGSCFPKDMNALVAMAHDRGWKVPLLDAVVEVNRRRPAAIIARLQAEAGGLKDRKVALLGLAFKPGTDDWRNSPSRPLVQALLAEGAQVVAWDPLVEAEAVAEWQGLVGLVRDPRQALEGAHAALIATAWPEITQWPWQNLPALMAQALIYDGRNLLSHLTWPTDVRYIPAGAGPSYGEA